MMLIMPSPLFARKTTVATPAGFSPLSAGPTAWYDPSDLSTLFQDIAGTVPVTVHGDPVGKMLDKSGNGYHATQGTAGRRPLYQTGGFLLFDGVDDYISAVFTLNQPFDCVGAYRTIVYASNTCITGAGNNTAVGPLNYNNSPQITLFAGGVDVVTGDQVVGTNFALVEVFNGAASSIQVDNGIVVSGNPGGNSKAGLTIAGANNGGGNHANIRFYGIAMKAGGFTAPQRADLKTYIGAKAGLTL